MLPSKTKALNLEVLSDMNVTSNDLILGCAFSDPYTKNARERKRQFPSPTINHLFLPILLKMSSGSLGVSGSATSTYVHAYKLIYITSKRQLLATNL